MAIVGNGPLSADDHRCDSNKLCDTGHMSRTIRQGFGLPFVECHIDEWHTLHSTLLFQHPPVVTPEIYMCRNIAKHDWVVRFNYLDNFLPGERVDVWVGRSDLLGGQPPESD